jgi:hypothetical protein
MSRAEDAKISCKFFEQCALLRIGRQLGNEFAILRVSKQHFVDCLQIFIAATRCGSIRGAEYCPSLAASPWPRRQLEEHHTG